MRTLVSKTLCLGAAALAGALTLGGCGFTPLYGSPGVSSGLSSIQVIAPDGRLGYLVREDLDDALARDKSAPPAWRLEFQVMQARQARGLRADATAERYELDITVNWTLTEVATGRVARTGSVTTNASYDAAEQPYAGIAARQDTQARAASEAARKIQLDLAAFMAGKPAG